MRHNAVTTGAQGIMYDGVDLSYHFDITDISIQAFPEIELSTTKIPGKPGTRFAEREIGERGITLKMSIKGRDRNKIHLYQFWRELAPLIFKAEPAPMKFDEYKEINVIATSSSEIERLGTRGVSEIGFVANDPFFYGRTYEMPLSTTSSEFIVSGGYDVWPTIEVTGASGELIIINEVSGERIRIPSVASSSARVVVDMERGRCTVNGSYIPVDMSISDYFSLPLGKAKLKLSKGSGVLKYRERYL